MSTQEYRRRALADMAASKSFYHMASEEEEEYGSEEEDVEEGSAAPPGYTPPTITANGATPGAATAQAASAADAAAAAAVRAATTVAAAPPGRSGRPGWQQALAAVDRPFLLLLQATVPLVEASSYRRWWFLLSMGCSPVFICCFYLGLLGWLPLLVAAAVGGTLAGLAALGTAGLEGQAPEWGLGTGYPIGAALVAVYGFCLAAMWIDTFASGEGCLWRAGGGACRAKEPANVACGQTCHPATLPVLTVAQCTVALLPRGSLSRGPIVLRPWRIHSLNFLPAVLQRSWASSASSGCFLRWTRRSWASPCWPGVTA